MQELLLKIEEMRSAQKVLINILPSKKEKLLRRLAEKIEHCEDSILLENKKDVDQFLKNPQHEKALVDRLTLNKNRLKSMVSGLNDIAERPDPVGQVVSSKKLENGLQLQQIRSPLGVIFLIFESRPNVITEAFALAWKAGNALLMKGGKESEATSALIYALIEESLIEEGLPNSVFLGLLGAPRSTTDFLIKQKKLIDVLIPRGGDQLIEYVTEHSRIPIIKNDRGLCHVYVHTEAKLSMALEIIENAKVQRPSVCNSMETLLLDEKIATVFLPQVISTLGKKGVIFFVCQNSWEILKSTNIESSLIRTNVKLATMKHFQTEYLDLKMNIKIVKQFDEALSHIGIFGSNHSEAIITENKEIAIHFQKNVDAAAVYWNASTRFTDGGQFGMGGEIGISTQKLHVRGPVGIEELTSVRWIISGQGQIRT